jgi:hypothetical protein
VEVMCKTSGMVLLVFFLRNYEFWRPTIVGLQDCYWMEPRFVVNYVVKLIRKFLISEPTEGDESGLDNNQVKRNFLPTKYTTSQLQLHSYNFPVTTSQLQLHSYNFTVTTSQLQLHSYNLTVTTSQLQLHSYNFTTTT